ncbi:MAG: FtsX-like permease family protein [Spirulina sp. SIO3F2]|nr:FtsX-like permease family protein [Spirulina sp. SIO3F2]
MRKIPIAWLQLSYQKVRFLTASLGIAAAITLMFLQLGLLGALDESNIILHQNLRGDLVMLSKETEALVIAKDFSRRRLNQVLNFSEVQSVAPLYFNQRNFKNVRQGRIRAIAIFGINPHQSPLDFPTIDQQIEQITTPDVVLFDQNSRPEYGTIAEDFAAGRESLVEVNEQRMKIGGIIDFTGTSFGITGNLVMSDTTFLRLSPEKNAETIALGVIFLADQINPEQTAQQLQAQLPDDVNILTIEQFIAKEKRYWQETTAVGFIFQMGVIVGFLIGMYIVYQILYTDISDHIPDYAILKAKGYQNNYFWGVLLQEALILSVSSYIPGYLLSIALYKIVGAGTGLPIFMTQERALIVLSLTLFMCLFSGFLVTRKLKDSDPADLF